MLKMVVLPAPFGPIRPLMSPSGTAKEALLTARRPRNDLEMPRTSSSATRPPGKEEQRDRHERDDPQQRIDEEQVDADVALAAAGDARLVERLEHRVAGPAERGDENAGSAPQKIKAGKNGGRHEGGERPLDE